jgi:6-phosphogluconate dehydrogenase (decarboxylating)
MVVRWGVACFRRAAAGGVGGGGVGFGYGWCLVVGGSEEQWSFLVSLLRGSLWCKVQFYEGRHPDSILFLIKKFFLHYGAIKGKHKKYVE